MGFAGGGSESGLAHNQVKLGATPRLRYKFVLCS